MNKTERFIVTAYTGVLMCDFSEFHKYAEELLGRRLFPHEFVLKEVWTELKFKTKDDFFRICKAADYDWETAVNDFADRLRETVGVGAGLTPQMEKQVKRHINDTLISFVVEEK